MIQNQTVSVSGVTLRCGPAPERGLSARRLSALRAAGFMQMADAQLSL
jgi:hypothetical protein